LRWVDAGTALAPCTAMRRSLLRLLVLTVFAGLIGGCLVTTSGRPGHSERGQRCKSGKVLVQHKGKWKCKKHKKAKKHKAHKHDKHKNKKRGKR
jgi:hypothetical protein